jgi:hypothetical protein
VKYHVLVISLLCAAACGGDADRPASSADTTATAPPVVTDAADTTILYGTARRVVGFLRGDLPFDSTLFADSVTLYVAPEGGGAERTLPRAALADRANWRVGEHTFTPGAGLDEETLRAGRHLNCTERSLSSKLPSRAGQPHVGFMLQPADADSCLQSWNATVIFTREEAAPRVEAMLYDQWEW